MSEAQQDHDNSPPYDHSQYSLQILLVSDRRDRREPQEWIAILKFRCQDLPQLMQEGLFWTASNVVPALGYIEPTTTHNGPPGDWIRHWELREWPNKPPDKSRWVASLALRSAKYQHA